MHLPQGADIKKVKYFFASSVAATPGVGGVLRISNLATGNTTGVAGGDFPNSAGVRSSMTHSVPAAQQTVDNKTNAYAVTVCFTGERSFGGVRIQYRYFNAGN
ncbi:MAG: hypothetical protein M3280_05490 [Actinomycetota bacterium]|nr:hypothetical protein [Actinomycetota bacterium]